MAYVTEFNSVEEERRDEYFPENNGTSGGCGGSHVSFGGRLQQQSEVTDGLVDVRHRGQDKPQLGTSSAQAQSADYARLLIQASDIQTPMAFTAGPAIPNPNGQAGVDTTFSNDDKTRQIHDTILVFGDPAAATSALEAAKAKLGDSVKGTPGPAAVGTGGTTVSGNSPDGSKGVMMVLFAEGKAFATLNFVGPPDMLPPPDFAIELGQKQDTAIKNGLSG